MSHRATAWEVAQRGHSPAVKVILWHLADRHNPDNGCFPSQDTLAADCEMSRASVNTHLKTPEDTGLIKRVAQVNPKTKRQERTRYYLPFEEGFEAIILPDTQPVKQSAGEPELPFGESGPCPESGHGSVSKNAGEPCPDLSESRVQNLDTNLVREPVTETCVDRVADTH